MATIWSGRTRGGIDVDLKTLHVSGTYDGLLWGSPNAEMNQRLVAQAVKAGGSSDSTSPVYLVPPRFVTREPPPPDYLQNRAQPHADLPAFRCIGYFVCFKPREEENHASALTIVWFQDRSPVEGIELELGELDWFAHARDFCY